MVAFLLAAGMTWVYIDYFESPEEALLRKRLNQSQYYGEIQDQQLAEMEKMLASLENRDDNIYRVIFGVEPVPEQPSTIIWPGSTYGAIIFNIKANGFWLLWMIFWSSV